LIKLSEKRYQKTISSLKPNDVVLERTKDKKLKEAKFIDVPGH